MLTLDHLGFAPVESRANEEGATYTGPGPDGATVLLVLGADTVPRWLEVADHHGVDTTTFSEVEFRPDTR